MTLLLFEVYGEVLSLIGMLWMLSRLREESCWDKRVFAKMDVIVGKFFVSVLLRRVMDDFIWACTGVYGPNDDTQRSFLWEELLRVRARWPMT